MLITFYNEEQKVKSAFEKPKQGRNLQFWFDRGGVTFLTPELFSVAHDYTQPEDSKALVTRSGWWLTVRNWPLEVVLIDVLYGEAPPWVQPLTLLRAIYDRKGTTF